MGLVFNSAPADFSMGKPKFAPFEKLTGLNSIKQKLNEVTTLSSVYQMIVTNPDVLKLLSELKIPLIINIKNLENLSSNHLLDTKKVAEGLINNLSESIKSKVDKKSVLEACAFHDFGKVLIPEKIINKAGALTPEEQKIMSKHSDIGYELLKKSNLNKKTLELIKNHHSKSSDINLQIVSIADMYSALREERVYKKSMSKEKALGIIFKEVQNSRFNIAVFKALSDLVKSEATQQSVVHLQPPIYKPIPVPILQKR